MSNIFNFKRFGKYFCYDLRTAWQNAGISVIVISLMPIWFFLLDELFSIVFNGHFTTITQQFVLVAYMMAIFFLFMFFPKQHYGSLTDKQKGSDWLMLPASRLEKFLSMLIVTCVALPVVAMALLAGSDLLLSSVFNQYDVPLVSTMLDWTHKTLAEFHTDNINFAMSGPYALWLNWCESVLVFTLGAIYFKRNKIVFTYLSLLAIGIVVALVVGLCAGGNFDLEPRDFDEDSLMKMLNVGVYALYAVIFAALDLGLYFRIKTLKH